MNHGTQFGWRSRRRQAEAERLHDDHAGWFAVVGIGWQFLIAFGGFSPWIGLLLLVGVVVLSRPRVPRLKRGARRHLLVLHVATSVGWLGIAMTMLLLSIESPRV